MQQSAYEHAALIWTRPSNTIRARSMKMAAEKAGHMSAPDDAPKEALKIPLAKAAVTQVAIVAKAERIPFPATISACERSWACRVT